MKFSKVYDAPDIYDAEMDNWSQDLVFWKWVLEQRRPKRVLELAAGTGRITLPLGLHGQTLDANFEIVGLDLSPAFLASAHQKRNLLPKEQAKGIQFVEQDMRSFSLEGQFDLIFIGLNSFMELHDIDDQISCLRAVHKHLTPGGCFGFDMTAPFFLWHIPDLLDSPPLRLRYNQPVPSLGLERFLQYCAQGYRIMNQTFSLHRVNELAYADGTHEQSIQDTTLHVYFPSELMLLLRVAGLQPIERFGNYLREPFHSKSWQYVWLSEKSEPALFNEIQAVAESPSDSFKEGEDNGNQ